MFDPRIGFASLVIATSLVAPAGAQGMRDVEIIATQVRGNVYMLEGRGGNIGLSIGDDGAFLIDDQFAPLTPKILAKVAELTDQPVKFVVNTHWHGDHTGGNENLGKLGAIIVAHHQVRERMSKGQFMEAFGNEVPPAAAAALPVITFQDAITLHWNDETIEVLHVEPAHTDGDSLIAFRSANVIHMGDTFFNKSYPFIDTGSGGSLDGVIAAADLALEMCDDDTRIIPGHGPLAGPDDLRVYRDMLAKVRENITALVEAGKSREEIIAAGPTREFDAGWGQGFMKPDQWLGLLLDGMGQ